MSSCSGLEKDHRICLETQWWKGNRLEKAWQEHIYAWKPYSQPPLEQCRLYASWSFLCGNVDRPNANFRLWGIKFKCWLIPFKCVSHTVSITVFIICTFCQSITFGLHSDIWFDLFFLLGTKTQRTVLYILVMVNNC